MRMPFLTAVVAVLALLSGDASAAGRASAGDPGQSAARAFGASYVRTLNANDPDRLSALIGEPTSAPGVQLRRTRFGGRELVVSEIVATPQVTRFYRLEISAREATSGDAVELDELLQWKDGQWRLGPPPQQTPAPAPTCKCQDW